MQIVQRILFIIGLIAGLLFSTSQALAGGNICVTVASGNWSTPGTWDCGGGATPPEASDFVTITNGFTVLLDVDATVNNLVVDAGGDLNIDASPGGLTLSWDEPGGDLSNASIDLMGDLTIDVNNGEDFSIGSVNGGFNLILNGSGQTIFSGLIGGTTPLNSLTTDVAGSTLISITDPAPRRIDTNSDQVFNDPVTISGNTSLRPLMGALIFNSTLDEGAANVQLGVLTSTGLFFNGQVGGISPLGSMQIGGPSTQVNTDIVAVSDAQRYGNSVIIAASVQFSGSEVDFAGELNDDGDSGTGSGVTIVSDNLTQLVNVGNTSPINSLTTDAAGVTMISGDITTTALQDFGDDLSLDNDVTLASTSGGNIFIRGDVTGPHNLVMNTSGDSHFIEPFPTDGKIVDVASITTDAAGTTIFERSDTFMLNSATATTFNDNVAVGPGCNCVFDQTGTGNVVFNGNISRRSGGPNNLTVNDVSGQTIFNGTVEIGSLTTNDGAGADSTVIAGGSVSSTAAQTYNDPLVLMADTTLASTSSGNITINDISGTQSLVINTAGFSSFAGNAGSPRLTSITTDAPGFTSFITLNVDGAAATTFNDTVLFDTIGSKTIDQMGSGNIVFNGIQNPSADPASTLTVNDVSGQTIFNGTVDVGALTTNDGAGADSTVIAGGSVSSSAAQTYNDPMILMTDTILASTGNGNGNGTIRLDDVNGANALTINTSGVTEYRGNVGTVTRLTSIVTDTSGSNLFTSSSDFIQVNGSAATVFAGTTTLSAATDITIDQSGSGNVVFDGQINDASGSPHRLTINDVSGQTIFNGPVSVGVLTTNDGAGADSTLVAGGMVNTDQGGADSGLMTFNDPVVVSGNMTFSEQDAGQIIFNNTLNGLFGRGLPDTIRINSDNQVILNTVGDDFPPSSLMTDADGSVLLNGDITTDSILRFGDAVLVAADIQLMNFNAINVVFDSTVDDDGDDMTGSAVTLSADTGSVFLNAIGSVNPLDSLTINSSARLAGDVTTSGGQMYQTDAFIDASLQVTGDNIVFSNNINRVGDPSAGLTIDAASSVGITGAAGNVGSPLNFLRSMSNAPVQLNIIEAVTSNDQQYGGPVTFGNTATLFGSFIDFDDTVDLGSNDLTLNTIAGGGVAAAPISGSGGLTKDGSGGFNLAAANTFTGGVTHDGGTLLIDGSTAVTSAVNVNSATLGGNGTANGPVMLTNSMLTPGTSPGIFSTGDLMLDTNSTLAVEIDGVFAGTEHDQVQVTGSVTLDDSELVISGSYVPGGLSDVIVLIVNDGADAVLGTFEGLPEGVFVNNNGPMTLTYAGGDGNDVALIDDEALFADSFESIN